eukprot:TRINITY_DN26955_c0_g1_i1.p1 TRINITY_DN26955_c0_g1~~TRINITY_DN26955_c0_g1_i1.p1  ORF type:complete len:507 (-),score=60.48 TRINITY_DN26955_c0_g1_i1:48-1568(-)
MVRCPRSCCCTCVLIQVCILAFLVLTQWYTVFFPESLSSKTQSHLGPFCTDVDGHLQCKSRKLLCGCASGSCEEGGNVDWESLRNLNFTGGIVRMATFKKEMKIPGACAWNGGPRVDSTLLIRLLGGVVEKKTNADGSSRPPCTQAPTHAWNEIELPHSNCFLMLGGQTSAFRDRGFHAFRVVLHDTTWRFWERERGKLSYDGLLLHHQRPLSEQHVKLLKHIIDNGDRRQVDRKTSASQFERSLDQGYDLSPIFLEFVPAAFSFQDDALLSMIAAYFGLFGVYRVLPFMPQVRVNCVVVALLFGRDPKGLQSLVPKESHQQIRLHARRLNDLWQEELAPIFDEASNVFKTSTEVTLPQTWQQQWCLRWLFPRRKTKTLTLDFQEQIHHFRADYLRKVLSPLKRALLQYSNELEAYWSQKFALADELLEYKLDTFSVLKDQTSEGCEATSVVDQLLFCPDFKKMKHWQDTRKTVTGSTVVTETDRAVRSLLYWHAIDQITGTKEQK